MDDNKLQSTFSGFWKSVTTGDIEDVSDKVCEQIHETACELVELKDRANNLAHAINDLEEELDMLEEFRRALVTLKEARSRYVQASNRIAISGFDSVHIPEK